MAPKKQSKRPLKATLLSGFLGSGKTSLMRHVLANREGLRCAVVVNEISELNLDADALVGTKLIKSDEHLVEMANGCICCTLREDLLKQLRELASSGKFDCVLIESSGIAEPMQVAEAFFVDIGDGKGQLQHDCALDNCVTVVDGSSFMDYMSRIDTISAIDDSARGSDEDRDIAQLFMDQLEFANVVIVNKLDLIKGPDREQRVAELLALVRKLAPKAKVMTAVHSRVPLSDIVNTGNFTLDFANTQLDWMEDIKSGVKHVPETLEYGVSSFMFRADKPFHPTRLYKWLTRNFVLRESTDNESLSEDVSAKQASIISTTSASRTSAYGNLFRSKGFIWIGSPERNERFGEWSHVGNRLTLVGGSDWDDLPQPDSRRCFGRPQPQQLLSFVGQFLNATQLAADLNALLMTEGELADLMEYIEVAGPRGTLYLDEFKPWLEAATQPDLSQDAEFNEECEEESNVEDDDDHRDANGKAGDMPFAEEWERAYDDDDDDGYENQPID